jgi:predicted adenylyl cyclase CyaB
MPRNIEIKARLADPDSMQQLVADLATDGPMLLTQADIFYHTKAGRLKLRRIGDEEAELIWYERPDTEEACESRYTRCPIPEPGTLHSILSATLGVAGTVRKQRTLFHIGQTRVHLDEVEELGNFIELEVVLGGDQNATDGKSIAESLMEQLGIRQDDLVACAYVDLLTEDS